jgi:arylsulfatase A-like enzyme
MKTPNLDRLAQEGCVFSNAYSPNPVCMPARHYMMTGQSARLHGYYGNRHAPISDEGIPTIPQVLSDHGYNTAAIGKMHFYPPRRHHGFDEMHLMEEIPESRLADAYLQYLEEAGLGDIRDIHGVRPAIYHTPQKALMPEKDHGANWVAAKSIEWLEQNGDEPFFLMCGWIKPHPPWNLPEEWKDHYKDADLPEPLPFSREFPYLEEKSDWFGDNDSEELKREIREAYYSSISMVDAAVGRVVDCLERIGQLDNTFIIFTSDHGEMLQDKGLYSKAVPYESAAHIPFVVRYPELFKQGSTNDEFVDLLDLFPSILELTGIDYNYKDIHKKYPLIGKSFLDSSNKSEYQFADYGMGTGRWCMIRDKRYKYVYYYNGGTELFFDMQEDPGELNNLVKRGNFPNNDFERLKKVCIEYEKERGPEGSIVDDDFIALPPETFNPAQPSSKFPMWANVHFQRFAKESSEREAKIFISEFKAVQRKPEKIKENTMEDQAWRDELMKNFRSIGGKEEDLKKELDGVSS